jgi:hypothetical protein
MYVLYNTAATKLPMADKNGFISTDNLCIDTAKLLSSFDMKLARARYVYF